MTELLSRDADWSVNALQGIETIVKNGLKLRYREILMDSTFAP